MVSSPTVETMENSLDVNSTLSMTRRSSASGYTIGDTETRNGPTQSEVEQDGFYLLKKNSQRRMTLSRVLMQDEGRICADWMAHIGHEIGDTKLTYVSLYSSYYFETKKVTDYTTRISFILESLAVTPSRFEGIYL